jgi:NADH dehydrogenase FAD-containing subunit
MKKLVLLGSSAEHLQVLRDLAHFPLANTQVTLVCPRARHVHAPLLSQCVAGQLSLQDISVAMQPWVEQAGASLIESEVLMLDAEQRQLTLTNGHVVDYDILSIASNGVANRDSIYGAHENALFVRSIDRFIDAWETLMARGDWDIRKPLSLIVVGAGAQAFELSLAAQKRLAGRGRVALVTGGGALLPGHPRAFGRRAKKILQQGRVTLFNEHCEGIYSSQMQLSRNLRLACDVALVALEPSAPLWLSGSDLALDAQGLLRTNAAMQSLSHASVFAVGELVSLAPQPQSSRAPYALALWGEALLTRNLRAALVGAEPRARSAAAPLWHALALADGRALGRLGKWSVAGKSGGFLKAQIDQRFVRRYSVVKTAPVSAHSHTALFPSTLGCSE